jgi:hypothetical protein
LSAIEFAFFVSHGEPLTTTLINALNEIPSDQLVRCAKQIKVRLTCSHSWGATQQAIVEQFGHDPAQESLATSRHGKSEVKVVRI